MSEQAPHVGFFVTCLVDLMRPSVGFAAIRLMEDAGCRVSVPDDQTCCGQPAYNTGDRADAVAIAKRVIERFEGFDYTVLPSGSCAGMICKHYPELFADDPDWQDRADALAAKTHELTSFLVDILWVREVPGDFRGKVTYHDSCSGLRELGVKAQPRALLEGVDGLELVEAEKSETCCGFGGSFCVKYPDISGAMVGDKADDIIATGADMVLAGDMGCLLNIAGRLSEKGAKTQVRHVAEVLAGFGDSAAIGRGGKD
ncbi:MAG: (Fe-S)-binding protein [Rhodospirillales bacterium]|nr:(Fe-S)-binding protein [Alphaproteobacteria bacterium]MBL6928769.1 (Fe-S)-binding protein [Rhodospirillales bacterium]